MAETTSPRSSRPAITTHFPFWQNGRKPFSHPFTFERPDEPHVVAREDAVFRVKMDDVLVAQGFRRDSAELAAASDRIIGQLSKNDRNLLVAGMSLPSGIMALIEAEKTKAGIATARPVNEFSAEGAKTPSGDASKELDGRTPSRRFDPLTGVNSNAPKGGFSSSTAFAELKDESNPAYIAAREWAVKNGMGWAPPDLLRLGPEAIKTMHAVGFDKQVYGDMTGRGKFKAEQVVSIAKFAKRNNMSPEEARELAKASTDVSEEMGKVDPVLQRRFREGLADYMESQDDPKKRAHLEGILREGEKHNPAMKEQNDKLRQQVDQATQTRDAAVSTADTKEDEAGSKADAELAMWGGGGVIVKPVDAGSKPGEGGDKQQAAPAKQAAASEATRPQVNHAMAPAAKPPSPSG